MIGTASISPASAQAPYPNRPIRIVVPFGPGGVAEITVRLLGQKLTERTNAQVVIQNRPGAGLASPMTRRELQRARLA